MLVTPCPRDPKTQKVVKTLVASIGYELASGSTLHQVHDVTAWDDPEVIQDLNEDIEFVEDDDVDDEITYLETRQTGQSELGNLPADTDTTSVPKSKKKKSTKSKTDEKAEEAAL